LANALVGAALALAPATAFAQQAPSSPPPASPDSVGPGTLQDFSLNGTVTRPADQPAAEAPAKKAQPAQGQPTISAATTAAPPKTRARPELAPAQAAVVHSRTPLQLQPADEPPSRSPSSSSATAGVPNPVAAPATVTATPTSAAPPSFTPAPSSSGRLAPAQGLGMFPWLLAALVLGAGGAFLFWRNRSRPAVVAGPTFDLFTPPEPEPGIAPPPAAPKPAPAPAPTPRSPASPGVVSSLRPWVEIGLQPLRCILEEQLVRVEFEVELFNSGSSPARDILVEAMLVNAGQAQEEQLSAFFAKRAGAGERLPVLPPLKRIVLKNQVIAPREQLQTYELAGRQLFVPLIAFNAFYRSTSGEAQTSVSYLLGRDTNGEKLAPFRADLGPRIFRGLAARPLPGGVRR
jgi:hypothetical protein